MKIGVLKLSILLILLITLIGCASRRQMDSMEARLGNIERTTAATMERVAKLDSLSHAQEEAQRAFLTRMEASIAAFEERLDQLNYKLTDLTDRIGRLGADLRQPVAVLGTTDSTRDTTGQKPKTAVDAGVIYSSAFKSLQAGNNEIAILGFKEYLASFPGTDLTDDAQFWLGECYYQMNPPDYQSAKAEFQKVINNFPQSDKIPEALFKLARSHEELKENQEAIRIYREIMQKYPQSVAANRSKVQLEGLGEKQDQ